MPKIVRFREVRPRDSEVEPRGTSEGTIRMHFLLSSSKILIENK